MALLSQMMRNAAFTGDTDSIYARIAGRQGRQWAEQTVRGVYPATRGRKPPPRQRPPHDGLAQLTALRERGIVTDAEFEALRARLPA